MPPLPTPALRALAGLAEGSGRTIVVAGPPDSGKSEFLLAIRHELDLQGARIVGLRGTFRERSTSYGAVARIWEQTFESAPETPPEPGDTSAQAEPDLGSPWVGPGTEVDGYVASEPAGTRRSRSDHGRRSRSFLEPANRPRGGSVVDPTGFWNQLISSWRTGSFGPLAFVVDDASLLDLESRNFLLYMSQRARRRPALIVFALDSSSPQFRDWEELLQGRGDVEWIRFAQPKSDPRDVRRLHERYDVLPDSTRRVLGYTALLGGQANEMTLHRITRLGFPDLADALLPATEAGLVRMVGTRAVFSQEWVGQFLPELIPTEQRREMHGEIAEALAAMHPEPNLTHRLELAHHFFEWYPGPNALRYLLEAAEISDRLSAFDEAERLLAMALQCINGLPEADRAEAESEVRLLRARALLFAGCIAQAQRELGEGISTAILGHVDPERLEEWLEPIYSAVRAVGPRASLRTELMEYSDRLLEAGCLGAATLLQSAVAELDVAAGRFDRGRMEGDRAIRRTRGLGPLPIQGAPLTAIGLALIPGGPAEVELARRFLHTAVRLLQSGRRYTLEHHAREVEVRLLEEAGQWKAALEARVHALPNAQRLRLLPLELEHQLGLARVGLELRAGERVTRALRRARELVDTLHLVPPSPAFLALGLLEGRNALAVGDREIAREAFGSVADLSGPQAPAPQRAEAILRLALLEVDAGDLESAFAHAARLQEPELRAALRPVWRAWLDEKLPNWPSHRLTAPPAPRGRSGPPPVVPELPSEPPSPVEATGAELPGADVAVADAPPSSRRRRRR